jgi:F-type H+-transporting ATPase subunit gamma
MFLFVFVAPTEAPTAATMAAKLNFYKEKLEGYKRFYSIVKTIKMVTIAKYRMCVGRVKTRDHTLKYTEKMFGGEYVAEEAAIAAAKGTLLYIPMMSNRGSCGSINSNVAKYVEEAMGKNTKVMPIGKKGTDKFAKLYPAEFAFGIFNDMKNAQNFGFATYVLECGQMVATDIDRTQIVYSRYLSAGSQRQAIYNIPNFTSWMEKLNDSASTENDKANYSFANAVLNNDEQFVRDFYDFHSALLVNSAASENELSEYAARVVAVEGQLSNIMQLQSDTQMLYNKTRQGSITAALIEILSAMNALADDSAQAVTKGKFWEVKAAVNQ